MLTKKLKLYGEKGDFKGFIAEIRMNGKELIIESEDEKVKQDLLKEINKHIENDEFFYTPEIIDDELEDVDSFSRQKPGDPIFLKAVLSEFSKVIGMGQEGKFANNKFGGYNINAQKSKLVDE